MPVMHARDITKAGARGSPEGNLHDVVHLGESRRLLPAGKALCVSHLPKQPMAGD